MYTCKIIMCTCIDNYVYMQDNYVYMQDDYVYIITQYFFHISQNWCSAMKRLCSDVPSGPPYIFLVLRIIQTGHNLTNMMTSSNGEKNPRYWLFMRGIHRWPVNSPHKGQWRGPVMFWSAPQQTADQTLETPVIWIAIALFMTSLWWKSFVS